MVIIDASERKFIPAMLSMTFSKAVIPMNLKMFELGAMPAVRNLLLVATGVGNRAERGQEITQNITFLYAKDLDVYKDTMISRGRKAERVSRRTYGDRSGG